MKNGRMFLGSLGIVWLLFATSGSAEIVIVKYRGPVDLSHFACEQITRSSVVKRLCYDSRERYVIVNLTGTYYHYCEVPPDTVVAWRKAESMGQFYNTQVKGRFDCRVLHVPSYDK
jgi:KTSC domain